MATDEPGSAPEPSRPDVAWTAARAAAGAIAVAALAFGLWKVRSIVVLLHLRNLPSGTSIFHPIATYGHKATDAIVAFFFTLAATW